MKTRILPDAFSVSKAAAGLIAEEARKSVAARGRFVMAVSGGKTPWQMLRDLASEEVPWNDVHVVQVDERIAPSGDPDRNLTHLRESLLSSAPIPPENIHAMPVENPDPNQAALDYTATLNSLCGEPPVLDLVHLGLGPDGHTASLIPGDPVCDVLNAEVSSTGIYQNRRRLTLTYPVINRARRILWVVTGAEKAPMVPRMLMGDPTIPAGPIAQSNATLLLDAPAAESLAD
ncbi:MAG: 6-phosphogluconolactonase [Verrucomicrobiota bacterium]